MAKADRPIADARFLVDKGDCKMPRITLKSCEDWEQICEGPSHAWPEFSLILAGSLRVSARIGDFVHDLFQAKLGVLALLVLCCAMTQAFFSGRSQIEVSAQVAVEARSRALGHMAKADRPIADARFLVIRQPE
jgi:hypothetical protein